MTVSPKNFGYRSTVEQEAIGFSLSSVLNQKRKDFFELFSAFCSTFEVVFLFSPTSSYHCKLAKIKPCVDNARLLDDTINEIMERTDQHGYAFSQEEGGVVSQSDVVRRYDSTKTKPYGL
ncbi:unnamed protein product [Dracunculus medinensis]|uniref:Uncharacterized protein n=1 Tax=Dracunculus medinensis TaxID=318479 RepID=A0A0N4U1I5_DRAME|nr:unnamed protein product [Dracunculus medinensis]